MTATAPTSPRPVPDPETDLTAVAQSVLDRLEAAWNGADGTAFGEPFSADADFVAIRGDLHTGREAIAGGHQSSTRSTPAARPATRSSRPGGSTTGSCWCTPA